MTIYFYSQTDAFSEFSNFSPHGIEMDGTWWKTVEHYYQAQKFDDLAYRQRIAKAATPKQAKVMGLTRERPLRPDWDEFRDKIMLEAVRKKFRTHRALADLLLSTGSEELAESAPGDFYWGVGGDGSGLNKLGKILMQVRQELRLSPITSA